MNQNAAWSNADLVNPLNQSLRLNEQISEQNEKLIKFPAKIRVLNQLKDSLKTSSVNLIASITDFSEKTNQIGNKISNVMINQTV